MVPFLISVGSIILFLMLTFWKKLKLWQKRGMSGFLLGLTLLCVLVFKFEHYFIDYFHYYFFIYTISCALFVIAMGKLFDWAFKNKNIIATIFFFFLLLIFIAAIHVLYCYYKFQEMM